MCGQVTGGIPNQQESDSGERSHGFWGWTGNLQFLLASEAADAGGRRSGAGAMRPIRSEPNQAVDVGLQLRVKMLMRKNYLLKMRQWTKLSCVLLPMGFIFEFCLPFGIAGLWSALSHLAKINVFYTGWSTQQYEAPSFQASTQCPQLDCSGPSCGGSVCGSYTPQVTAPPPFVDFLIRLHWTQAMDVPVKVAFAVDDPTLEAPLLTMQDWINTEWYPQLPLKNIPCFGPTVFAHFGISLADPSNLDPDILDNICGNRTGGVRAGNLSSFEEVTWTGPDKGKVWTTDEMDEYLESDQYATNAAHPQFYAAVVFHKIPGGGVNGSAGDWDYSIRLNHTMFGRFGAHEDTVSVTGQPITPGFLHSKLDMKAQDIYTGHFPQQTDGGFMTLQLLVDRLRDHTIQLEVTARAGWGCYWV